MSSIVPSKSSGIVTLDCLLYTYLHKHHTTLDSHSRKRLYLENSNYLLLLRSFIRSYAYKTGPATFNGNMYPFANSCEVLIALNEDLQAGTVYVKINKNAAGVTSLRLAELHTDVHQNESTLRSKVDTTLNVNLSIKERKDGKEIL